MKEPTKKIVAVIGTIGALASIVGLYIILNPHVITIDKEASIRIQGLEDFYLSSYNDDFTFSIIIENNGGEYVTIKDITVSQLLGSGKYAFYTNVKSEPSRPAIPIDSSVNINITLPSHEARETMEFKIRVTYNDYKYEESKVFEVVWH